MNGPAALALALASVAGITTSPGLEIVSDSSCPSADMTRTALSAIGGVAPERRAAVSIRDTGNGMVLAFQWDGDGPADVRAVEAPPPADCAQRARAAAVVIASWLGSLPAAPVTPPTPEVSANPGPPAPLSIPPKATRAPAATALPAEKGAWLFGLGLGAGTGGGIAPGARVELARTGSSSGRGAGWFVAALATSPRSRSVGDGTSHWIRPTLGAAAFFAWPVGATVVTADLGPVVAATIAWGSGYPANQTDTAPSLGGAAGARIQIATGPSRLWLELRAIRWLSSSQRLRFDSDVSGPATADLPQTEGFLTVGWSLPVK